MLDDAMLTTIDNPYNPFTQFDQWLTFDISKGYNTCGYLARITRTSESFTEAEESRAIDLAIDAIVKENILGIYRKVTRKDFEKE